MVAINVQIAETHQLGKIIADTKLTDYHKVRLYLLSVTDFLGEYLQIKHIAPRSESVRGDEAKEGASAAQITLGINIEQLPHYNEVIDIYKSMNQTERASLRGIWYLYNCLLDDMDANLAST